MAEALKEEYGITLRTIQYYVDEELIIPEVLHTHGRGTRRLFSARNVAQLLIIKTLSRYGVPLDDIKKIIHGPKPASWDPSVPRMPGKRDYIVLYDINTDHGFLDMTYVTKGKHLQLDMDNVDSQLKEYKGIYRTAMVVDISHLVEQVRNL